METNNLIDVKDLLAKRINNFRDLNQEKYSYKYMARKAGLSPSFVERAAKGKLGESLDAKKTMSLANLICTPEESRLVAEVLVSSLMTADNCVLQQALVEQFSKERERSNDEIERALEEDEVFITYVLCSGRNGASIEKLKMVLGDAGNIGLKKLQELGIIECKDDRFYIKDGKSFKQFETIKKQLGILARMYKPSNVGKEKNYVHIMSDGLTQEGVIAWQAEHRKHQEKLRELKNKYQGEIDVFSVGFMDTFLPN